MNAVPRVVPRVSPMSRYLALLTVVIVFPGCYEEFDGFARRASRLQCKRLHHCDDERFERNHDDKGDCRNATEDEWQAKRDNFEQLECSYDPDEGKDCIHAMYERRRECGSENDEAIQDACNLVFDCFP
jgi:hypothetical protein